MTVRELIKELEKQDQSALVYLEGQTCYSEADNVGEGSMMVGDNDSLSTVTIRYNK